MTVKRPVKFPVWVIGWHGKASIAGITVAGGVIGAAVGMPIMLGLLGFAVAPVAWYASVQHVNDNYEEVLDEFHAHIDRVTDEALAFQPEDNAEKYRAHYERGEKLFREPAEMYRTHTLVVTDHSLIVHDDAKLEMPLLDEDVGDSTQEFYFDSISSVNYDSEKREFWVNLDNGNGQRWPSERKPKDCLEDVQKRLREYKRQAAT